MFIGRLKHVYLVVVRPVWTWLIAGLLTMMSLAAFLRDEFLTGEQKESWKLLNVLPHWSWELWAIIFLAILILVVLEGSYRLDRERQAKISALEAKNELADLRKQKPLEVRFGTDPPYAWERDPYRHYRIGVYNPGPLVVDNVKVSLLRIEPRPRRLIRDNFPYRVPKIGTEWDIYSEMKIEDVRINPKEEQLFEVAKADIPTSDGMRIRGFDTRKHGESYPLTIESDEQLNLIYEITSSGGEPVSFSIRVYIDNQKIIVARKA